MKLGTQTGSLTNHVLARAVKGQPDATVGMGATMLSWTDRYPGTVIGIARERGATVLTVREDNATRTDKNGFSESQTYLFEPNENGRVHLFKMNKHGMWDEVARNEKTGRLVKTGGYGLRIGERAKYHDFSF
jgi:hypothetical protein